VHTCKHTHTRTYDQSQTERCRPAL
jgi:hypothetical protein